MLQYHLGAVDVQNDVYDFACRRIKNQTLYLIIIMSDVWICYFAHNTTGSEKHQCTEITQWMALTFLYALFFMTLAISYLLQQDFSSFESKNLDVISWGLLIVVKIVMCTTVSILIKEQDILDCEQLWLFVFCLSFAFLSEMLQKIIKLILSINSYFIFISRIQFNKTGFIWITIISLLYFLLILSIGYLGNLGIQGIESVNALINNIDLHQAEV